MYVLAWYPWVPVDTCLRMAPCEIVNLLVTEKVGSVNIIYGKKCFCGYIFYPPEVFAGLAVAVIVGVSRIVSQTGQRSYPLFSPSSQVSLTWHGAGGIPSLQDTCMSNENSSLPEGHITGLIYATLVINIHFNTSQSLMIKRHKFRVMSQILHR